MSDDISLAGFSGNRSVAKDLPLAPFPSITVSTSAHRICLRRRLFRWFRLGLGFTLMQAILAATPVFSAERIYVNYSLFERSIAVDDLAVYARKGELSKQLNSYARYLEPEQLEQLRTILLTPFDLDVVAISQFLYTPQGETLLRELGQIIRAGGRQSGFFAIRAALILAAADQQEGLTLLNVMQKFPTSSIRVDLGRAAELARAIEVVINQTHDAITLIEQQAYQEAAVESELNPSSFAARSIVAPGPFAWRMISLKSASLDFPVDLYLPEELRAAETTRPMPIIVVSHGLGNDRTTFIYLAEHLASHGFVVAVPEHPDSSDEQLLALLEGRTNEVIPPDEFINRPLDIQHLLDELERQAYIHPRLQGKLNLQQIGVIGQSFGGYTSLALSGARLNLSTLSSYCPPATDFFNVSLLLQCQALEISQSEQSLADSRIKAAIAVNPVGSALFGQENFSQIDIPLMVVAGSADTVAPALAEQIRPFTWLTHSDRYLLLIRGATHFSTIYEADSGAVPVPAAAIGPNPELAKDYLKAMSLAFFRTHVADNSDYRPFLTAAYANLLSREPLGLSLIRSLAVDQLANQ